MKIFAIGSDTDNTFRHFLSRSQECAKLPIQPINLRAVVERGEWFIEPHHECFILLDEHEVKISPGDPVYVRLLDAAPEMQKIANQTRWLNLKTAMSNFLQVHDGIVINRPLSGAHNAAKPLHEFLIRQQGFRVPKYFSSTSQQQLKEFCEKNASVLKALSGVRANCRAVNPQQQVVQPFDGPAFVQKRIHGHDLRVHVVGSTCHALKIESKILDYRIDTAAASYSKACLPIHIERLLISSTASFELTFAGWDFKVDEDGEYWCLEANPMPGYAGYDYALGGSITRSLVETLESRWRFPRQKLPPYSR